MDLLRGVQGPVVDRITDRYYAYFLEHVEKGVPVFPGVKETLARLSDRPIGTMTTRRHAAAKRMLEVAGLAPYFQAIVGSDAVSRPKPFPDLPLFSARSLGVPPEACAVVGDAPVDILAGRAARMRTVAVTYGYGSLAALREAKPHALVDRFGDLPAVLDSLEAGPS
jgi:phosphoglycolate phosphatase